MCQVENFAMTSSDLRPLHSAGCLPAKWRHIESNETMHAVISAVLTREGKHSWAEKSFFGSQRMKQGKTFLFMKYDIIWSHITIRKTRGRLSADRPSCSGAFPHHLMVMTRSKRTVAVWSQLCFIFIYLTEFICHVKWKESVYNLISDVKVHHNMYTVTESVYVSTVQIYNYLT